MTQSQNQNDQLATQMENLAQQLTTMAQSLRADPHSRLSPRDSGRLIESAEQLLMKIKPAIAHVIELMVVMAKFTALRLFIKWNLFEKIPVDGAISYSELAESIGAETPLISRLGSILVATNILQEIEVGKVEHTATSLEFISQKSPMSALACFGFDGHLRTISKLPSYFDTFGLREPTGKYNTAFSFAAGDASLSVWDHVNRNPDEMQNMMISMVAMASKTPVVGSYDFSWIVQKGHQQPDRMLIVDVGAGKGHALQAICDAAPGLDMARCVVEDLGAVVEEACASASGDLAKAQFVAIDFHKEQPIQKALIYYIRRCLHDYGDEDCVQILQCISSAMDYDSRLLIVEQIIKDVPSAVSVANDIFMALIGGKERTLAQFKGILNEAQLEIVEVFRTDGTDYAVIECRRV